jgi:hypothetical protein
VSDLLLQTNHHLTTFDFLQGFDAWEKENLWINCDSLCDLDSSTNYESLWNFDYSSYGVGSTDASDYGSSSDSSPGVFDPYHQVQYV